ncbi:MAG: hypothetical protein HYR55_15485 [Acidobacteria bacterium]|nr:hypothetical protein [Acidobacteriota bacterium]MBI3658197.1 hypothetical protein [Acidobacteriota bacterium]
MSRFQADDSIIIEKLRHALEKPLSRLDLDDLGKYNRSYTARYAVDRFDHFVLAEWPYYRAVLNWYRSHIPKGATVLDVGMFVPVMPLLLSWEGYHVTSIEKLALYGHSLSGMVSLVADHQVHFVDADLLFDSVSLPLFDAINLLGVVEHLLGSPRELLVRLRNLLNPRGYFLFAVPNQAWLVRRLGLLFAGVSVQPDFAEYFESSYPFSGHNR